MSWIRTELTVSDTSSKLQWRFSIHWWLSMSSPLLYGIAILFWCKVVTEVKIQKRRAVAHLTAGCWRQSWPEDPRLPGQSSAGGLLCQTSCIYWVTVKVKLALLLVNRLSYETTSSFQEGDICTGAHWADGAVELLFFKINVMDCKEGHTSRSSNHLKVGFSNPLTRLERIWSLNLGFHRMISVWRRYFKPYSLCLFTTV